MKELAYRSLESKCRSLDPISSLYFHWQTEVLSFQRPNIWQFTLFYAHKTPLLKPRFSCLGAMDIELRIHDNNVVLGDTLRHSRSFTLLSKKPMKNVLKATSCFTGGSHGCYQSSTNDTTNLYVFPKIECHGMYKPIMTIIRIDPIHLQSIHRVWQCAT